MKRTLYIHTREAQKATLAFVGCKGSPSGEAELSPARPLAVTVEGGGLAEVRFQKGGFTFKTDDARPSFPIFSASLGVAVTAEEGKSYAAVKAEIEKKCLKTRVNRIEEGAEPTLREAMKYSRASCPTFLTVPHNARLFEVGFRGYPIEERQHMELYDYIIPRINWDRLTFGEADRVVYRYLLGRGMGVTTRLSRSLEKGCLPVLTARLDDGGILYTATYFADVLTGSPADNAGTDYLEADFHSAAHVLSEEQRAAVEAMRPPKEEELPLLRMRITLKNRKQVPAYAFVRLPAVNTPVMAAADKLPQRYDKNTGFGYFGNKVYMTAFAGDKPADDMEFAHLLAPGESEDIDVVLFFEPVSEQTAQKAKVPFIAQKRQVERVWWDEFGTAAQWSLPDKNIDSALKTGFLQTKAACFGKRGDDVVAPCVGVYSPIATESVAIVLCLAEAGFTDLAERCVNYFFAKQRKDGFIQNMVGYMAETGGALYLAGRVFAITGDRAWMTRLLPGIKAAVGYIEGWINRNSDERRGGRGMIDGQVADPVDPYRSWSLNALAYAGLNQAAQVLAALGENAESARNLTKTLKSSIQCAYEEARIRAPLVPLDSGEWVPLVAPWADERAGCCLHLDGGTTVTHACSVGKDSMLSGTVLACLGLADERLAAELADVQCDLFTEELAAISQPYYGVHTLVNLALGRRKAFLKSYFTEFAAMSDKETHSFWEHTFLATPHKTSEQGAFMLRTLKMLFAEEGDRLIMFAGIPAAWTEAGKRTRLVGVKVAAGEFSVEVEGGKDEVKATFTCRWKGNAPEVVWRIPGTETTTVTPQNGTHVYTWKRLKNS